MLYTIIVKYMTIFIKFHCVASNKQNQKRHMIKRENAAK